MSRGIVMFLILLSATCLVLSASADDGGRHLVRLRRFLRFHSRPSKDADPQYGIGFKGHVKNFLNGGTVGVDFYVPGIRQFSDHIRKNVSPIFSRIEEEKEGKLGENIDEPERELGDEANRELEDEERQDPEEKAWENFIEPRKTISNI